MTDLDRLSPFSAMESMMKYDFNNQPEAIRKLFVEYDVSAYLDEYEFRGDGGDYAPNEQEFILIEDAIRGVLHDLHTKTLDALSTVPASPPASVGGARLEIRPVAKVDLVDGETYLVQCKHGLIEGRWEASEDSFAAYFWRDMSFWGEAFTMPGNPNASVTTPTPDPHSLLQEDAK